MASAAPDEAVSGTSTSATEKKAPLVDAPLSGDPPRLFVLCGRDRKVEELREMFARCGTIRQLHLATDRSNKSRGFAFLQFEDPASASEAIRQFDKTTLSDGHVLKVTVAREKTRTTVATVVKPPQPGKLKRNQHSQDDNDDQGDHDNSADGSSFQGKRQRSSPPTSVSASSMVQKVWRRTVPFAPVLTVPKPPEDEISDILSDIIAQVERMSQLDSAEKEKAAAVSVTPAAAKRKAPPGLSISAGDDGDKKKSQHSVTSREDCSGEISSNKQKSQRTTAEQATPLRHPREQINMHQRRRVAVDESDSSVDDASDASVGRRKRSNTEPEEADSEGVGATVSRRRLSDLSELSLSPAGISSPMTSKKRCSRRSSASSSSSSLPPFHVTPFTPMAPVYPTVFPPPPAAPSIRRRRTAPHSKLFFTSTVKFTEQELEAMFSIYEQFESVQLVKSFGRVKTMAYVLYTTAAAASLVLTSFMEDNEGEDHGMMKLVYADTDEQTNSAAYPPSSRRRQVLSTAGESTSSEIPVSEPTPIQTDEHCWLMILYDRSLSNEAISSCATSCKGMEYMDIKMFRSTGESQGVAFVKFESEVFTQAASRRLHNAEFPVGSRKFLQAIVIADPALFSTPHGASSSASAEPQSLQDHHAEDGDLGFVEARFAHLMSGASEQPIPTAHAVPFEEAYDGSNQSYSRNGVVMEQNPFVQGSNTPTYGYFQFGQPYPYAAAPLPHQSHPHPVHPNAFYHHESFSGRPHSWGYDSAYRDGEYGHYSWEPARHIEVGTNAPPVQTEATSVFVSSSRPLDLSSLMKAIQECPGVVGFTKEEKDGVSFVVDFGEPGQAAAAVSKLDGTMCNESKLRVAVASGHRPPPSRRKRQRLDQRGRRK